MLQVSYNMTLIYLYALIQFCKGNYVPHIYKGIASQAMIYFLLANLFTGLTNMYFQTALMDPFPATAVIVLYTVVLTGLFSFYTKT